MEVKIVNSVTKIVIELLPWEAHDLNVLLANTKPYDAVCAETRRRKDGGVTHDIHGVRDRLVAQLPTLFEE